MTITGLPRTFERHVPSSEAAVASFRALSRETNPSEVHWRFDPIVVTPETPVNAIEKKFAHLARELEGATRLCLASFVEEGPGRLDRLPAPVVDLPLDERRALLVRLAAVAARHGITLRSCRKEDAVAGIVEAATCIEGGDWHRPPIEAEAGERCACLDTVDVGTYDTCPAGCLYCYANLDFDRSIERRRCHLVTDVAMPQPARLLEEQTPKLDPTLVGPHPPGACEPCTATCAYAGSGGQRIEGALHAGVRWEAGSHGAEPGRTGRGVLK